MARFVVPLVGISARNADIDSIVVSPNAERSFDLTDDLDELNAEGAPPTLTAQAPVNLVKY